MFNILVIMLLLCIVIENILYKKVQKQFKENTCYDRIDLENNELLKQTEKDEKLLDL